MSEFIGMDFFKGEEGQRLLPSISSMCNSRGIPTAKEVNDFVQWLPLNDKKNLLILACRIFNSFGLPSKEKLTKNETLIRQYFKQYCCSTNHGDDNRDEDDDILESSQMKALALFCAAPTKWCMKMTELDKYLAAQQNARDQKMVAGDVLKPLLRILAIHGGSGLRFWIEMHSKNPHDKEALTKALAIPAPLTTIKFALTQLPEFERWEYLELCRNLKPAPTQAQWRAFNTVPTISQWHKLHRVFGKQKMQLFMDACLDYQATPRTPPDVEIQQRLLEGMLLANHYLPRHNNIPQLCFSKRTSTDDKKGVMVDGDHAMSGQTRLWHFITAMLIELEQTEYQFKHQRLTVIPADGEKVVLEYPTFTLTTTGFVIENWTLEQLSAFFEATEFTEQWYKIPQDKRNQSTIDLENKLAQMAERARSKAPKTVEPKNGISATVSDYHSHSIQ